MKLKPNVMLHEMSQEIALKIQQLRAGVPKHSWRRIAEIVCEEHPDFIKEYWSHGQPEEFHGNQVLGKDLCLDAAYILEVSDEDYETKWE